MSEPLVTVITGTSKGLGRFLAEHYVELGHQVIGCSRRDEGPRHERYKHVIANVSVEEDVCNLFTYVARTYGRLDHLVNNAGIASMNHFLLTPGQTAEHIFDTHVLGCFLCCREGVRLMRRHQFGRIVNVSTVAVRLKVAGEAIYASAKAAVDVLSGILAREVAAFGVTINVVAPTPIATGLIANVPKTKIDALLERQAIPRLTEVNDVANVIDFFLKKESGFVTGQTIYLGGV